MFIYRNGHDDYGKRDMTLRKLLNYIKEDIEECDIKDDMLEILSMLYNGELDAEYLPIPADIEDTIIEYTGLDPIYYAPRIDSLYNRQVVIVGDIFSERVSCLNYNTYISECVTITRRYLMNSKKIVCNLPFPITIEDQNWIQSILIEL